MLFSSSIYAQEQNFSFHIDGEDIEDNEIDVLPIDDSEYVVNKNFIPNGPTVINDVTRNMKSAGYWISKIKNPDKEILTKEQIKDKNKELFRDLIYLNSIDEFPESIQREEIIIPAGHKRHIMKELEQFGIDDSIMFPGFEHFLKYLCDKMRRGE